MRLDGKQSPVHSHSWRIEVEVSTFASGYDGAVVVNFADLERQVRAAVQPWQGQHLNNLPAFAGLQPTTENVARRLFDSVEQNIRPLGVALVSVGLWETPTKGIVLYLDSLPPALPAPLGREAGTAAGAASAPVAQPPAGPETPAVRAPVAVMPPLRYGPFSPKAAVLLCLAVMLAASLIYMPLLAPASPERLAIGYDGLGHLAKGEFLYGQIRQGNYLPAYWPDWYNGTAPFRYWAPLPYYLLALLRHLAGDIVVAGGWFIILCAAAGAACWLKFRPYLGTASSALAAAAWLIWPDHVRVALAEGNLPRVLATAFIPILVYLSLRLLLGEGTRWTPAWLALVVTAAILAHAMLAAMFLVALTLWAVVTRILNGTRVLAGLKLLGACALGVMASAWWLVPALRGGITDIEAQAVTDVITYYPLYESFNPLLRLADLDSFYWGLALVPLFLAAVVWRGHKPAWAQAALIVAAITILASTTAARPIYNHLPLHHLLWPARFGSFTAACALLGGFAFSAQQLTLGRRKFQVLGLVLALGLVVLLDGSGSLGMIGRQPVQAGLAVAVASVKEHPGWRVAMLDLSRLRSDAPYLLSQDPAKEQVFGWAWQGAVTGPNIVQVNTALETGHYGFLFDRLVELGVTQFILEKAVARRGPIDSAAAGQGFTLTQAGDRLQVWSRPVPGPYLLQTSYRCLAIGRYAPNVALLFPQAALGNSVYLDDYSVGELARYEVVVLSGFRWRVSEAAEHRIQEAAALGTRFVVDLQGAPPEVLSKRALFLGVYAEPVHLIGRLSLATTEGPVWLRPFAGGDEWNTIVPQGLDSEGATFSYFGERAAAFGHRSVGQGEVTFLGLNLIYHAVLTADPNAIDLLAGLLGLPPGEAPARRLIPLEAFSNTASGLRLVFVLPDDVTGPVVLPVAAVDGWRLSINGEAVGHRAFHNLVEFTPVAGVNEVVLVPGATPAHVAGAGLSLGALSLLLLTGWQAAYRPRERKVSA